VKKKNICYEAEKAKQKTEGQVSQSDTTTKDENSPPYQESNYSSSRTPSDDGNDEDDTGGGTASHTAQGGGYERPLSPFTADQFTHCTRTKITTSQHHQEF
jgi:hypothetical protein